MAESRSRQPYFGIAAIGVLAAIAAPDRTAADPSVEDVVEPAPRETSSYELASQTARFTLIAETGQLVVASSNGRTRVDLEMSLLVDGNERPIVIRKPDVARVDGSIKATFVVDIAEERLSGTLELKVDPTSDLVTASLAIAPRGTEPHACALRFSTTPGLAAVFVPERGELGDLGDVETRSVVVDDDVHPVGIATKDGLLTVAEGPPEIESQPGARPRLTSTLTLASSAAGEPSRGEATILLGASSDVFWGRLYTQLGVAVARVSGVVAGTTERAEVLGLDESGHELVRVPTSSGGHFVVEAPLEATRWYASLEAARTSTAVARYTPGSGGADLRLDVFPGGELSVRVVDDDTSAPVLARIVVRGVDGAVDPSFGHDFRASGAGPLVDVRTGELRVTLPPGRYRVSALEGPEWSIDSEVVEIGSGHAKELELRPRHVVPTPGLVACDLHVHAKPSFDTSVTAEDRLLSLASAGIDFAVPTEHNLIGDYTAAVERMDLNGKIAHVTGIEVTTYNPRIGHFGVFPYPKSAGILPYKHTSAGAIFAAARKGDPSRVLVVHHPRMPLGIGYFQLASFDSRSGKIPALMRSDYDVLEVYNGYEITTRAKTEAVLADWFALLNLGKRYPASGSSDSHKIQFQWAGYPRTYVQLEESKAGDTGAPIDTAAVVAAVKKGQGFVTSGPIVELEVEGAKPGGEVDVKNGHAAAHLRVRAAPWIDVTSIEIVAGGTSIYKTEVASRPTVTGREAGPFEEAAARAVRFDSELELTIPAGAKWIVAVVRGDRAYDDVLPFMPVQPMAFTNPIWVR